MKLPTILTAVAAICIATLVSTAQATAQEAKQRTTVVRLPAEVKQSINRGLELFAKSQNTDGSWGDSNRSGGTALGLMLPSPANRDAPAHPATRNAPL